MCWYSSIIELKNARWNIEIELRICVNEFACDCGYFWMGLGGLQEKGAIVAVMLKELRSHNGSVGALTTLQARRTNDRGSIHCNVTK